MVYGLILLITGIIYIIVSLNSPSVLPQLRWLYNRASLIVIMFQAMEVSQTSVLAVVGLIVAGILLWRILKWAWFRPRDLEKRLRQQGFRGNSYRLLFGDSKEMSIMTKEAKSKPIDFSNDIVARVIPHIHHALKTHGMYVILVHLQCVFCVISFDLILQVISASYGLARNLQCWYLNPNL